MTQICVSLTDETTAQVVERMRQLAGTADLFEVRGDLVTDLNLLEILRAKTEALLFTARSVSEGGRWDDADPRRRLVLLEAVRRGYDYVDVELRAGYPQVGIEKAGRGLVVSYHDLHGMPDDLDSLYKKMCKEGADIVKIAATPSSFADVGRLLGFARRVSEHDGPPLIAIALGPLGVLTRILAGRYGAPFTYASAERGREAAPGQLPAQLLADVYRVRQINRNTKVFGLLGADVERSLSPLLHNRAFAAAGIDAVYVPLQSDALEPFLQALPELQLTGFSVTRPFKVEILPFLDEVEESAALCGSVNTVLVHDGVLQGSTTDGLGVLAPLRRRVEVKGRPVAIVGAGGAARSAALALGRRGAQVTLFTRDPEKAAVVAAALGCSAGALAEIGEAAWDVLINATPVGSSSAPELAPVPASVHRASSVAFDMVYDPLETLFLKQARAAGATTIGGLEMLIAQAAFQFETWTGRDAPVDEMKAATAFLSAGEEGASP
jgi:3-dehydroquinate dehydratase/shikimate dehydrogenase